MTTSPLGDDQAGIRPSRMPAFVVGLLSKGELGNCLVQGLFGTLVDDASRHLLATWSNRPA